MPATIEMGEKEVRELADGLKAARQELEKTRSSAEESQTKLAKALKELEELKATQGGDSSARKKLEDTVSNLSGKIEQLANQNTNLVELVRKQSNTIADSGRMSEIAFRPRGIERGVAHGPSCFFESRQQAVEIGYFFMATMAPATNTRQYAQRWLKERVKDLRYLPQTPAFREGGSIKDLTQMLSGESLRQAQLFSDSRMASIGKQDLDTMTSPGSLLTFPQFADTFIRNVEEFGVARRNATIWPMSSDTTLIPRRKSGVTVVWVDEEGTLSEADPVWEQLRLTAKKVALLHKFSSELAEDEAAAISLADMIMFEFSLAFAIEEDRIAFKGDGTGGSSPGYAGYWGLMGLDRQDYAAEGSEDLNKVLRIAAATGLDRTDEVTLASLRKMIGLLHTWASPNAKWYGHRTVLQDLYAIETTGGGPITSSDESGRRTLLGYPTEPVEALPASPGTASTGAFALGDLRRALTIGTRRQLLVETSAHAAFTTDQLVTRFTSRFGFLWTMPTSMVVYVTAA